MIVPLNTGELITVAERLTDLLGHVKNKLIRQPNPAQYKLAVVLIELSKIFQVLDDALTEYLGILFDPAQPLTNETNKQDRQILIKLEGGVIKAEMKAARGHCGKIWHIYDKYLRRWFADLLSEDEGFQLYLIFQDLAQSDGEMITRIERMACWLSDEAKETYKLVSQRNLDAANGRIEQAHKEILPYREELADIIGKLREYEAELIQVSGAI